MFLYHRDALRLFGYNGKHYQRGVWEIKDKKTLVWFPKLYENGHWKNKLTNNSAEIVQEQYVDNRLIKTKLPSDDNRIVFAHYKNVLGQTVYKFYGLYEVDWKKTNNYTHVFRRISKSLVLSEYK